MFVLKFGTKYFDDSKLLSGDKVSNICSSYFMSRIYSFVTLFRKCCTSIVCVTPNDVISMFFMFSFVLLGIDSRLVIALNYLSHHVIKVQIRSKYS